MSHMPVMFFLFFLSTAAFAGCEPYVELMGSVNLAKKQWKEIVRGKNSQKVCVDPNAKNATLELVYTKGKNTHRQLVFSNLIGYYDFIQSNKLSGGVYDPKDIIVHSWAPVWVKGSKLRISELKSKKLIIEVQL